MGMAFMLSAGSICRGQGAIIVGPNQEPVGMGFDGLPKSMSNGEHSVHAEINAIFNSQCHTINCTIFITHTPCYHCVMSILAANIKKIIYFQTKSLDSDVADAVRCGFGQIQEYKGNLNWMRDHIRFLDIFK